ncbi:MAG: MraY family glycosyltransferase [Planctomycetota bacterium]|jgi:UDP-GlcNAc:undecaprenyl-phosphate GlcNAc-1-phosphate transferase
MNWEQLWPLPLAPLPAGILLLMAALISHRRLRAWLPEDSPGSGRKRHRRPTPMAGMVPALLSFAIALYLGREFLAAAILSALAVGLYDDCDKDKGDGIGWRIKGFGMLLAAVLVTIELQITTALPWQQAAVIGLLLFCLANALNFLDNCDGLATGLGCAALFWIAGWDGDMALLAFAWLAFLPFNWPRPVLFLGDQGALPLGICVAYASLERACDSDGCNLLAALAPCVLLVVDFTQVILMRMYLGYTPWTADRRHISHILMNWGLPAVLVAPVLVAVAVLAAWGTDSL